MKLIILLMSSLLLTARAQSKNLVCHIQDLPEIDIKIEKLSNKKEKISFILLGINGEKSDIYTNSNFTDGSLSKNIEKGYLETIVSNQNSKAALSLLFNPSAKRYDITFSMIDTHYTGKCL